ncbi:MAG: glycosyltransferase family 4 protein [Chloroflexota bacterium]|nr:glycosyltransferase family 4 protein [Chloroflexota bacterium]
MNERAPRVAYFTPLQPVESGISQYSEDLIPWLATALDLAVVVDNYEPTLASTLAPARIVAARRFDRRAYDAVIVQMGNSPAHNYMAPLALDRPDILVLHDIVLHHLMVWRAVQGRGGRDAYRREMRARYGERGEAVAAHVLRGQNPTAMFEFPLNEQFIRAARCVVTHSPSSAAWVQRLVPEARTHVVPMGVPIIAPRDRQGARARLGIGPETFVILSLGRVNPFKRIPAVFRAVRRLADDVPDLALLIVGGDSPNYDVSRLARFAGIERYVRRLGYLPDDELPDLFVASDVCINLRYPTAGETSAAVLRLMSAGLPTIVTDTGAFADLPDDAVLKVSPDAFEGETLVAFLHTLATDPAFRRAVGANARDFVLREHTMRRAAEGYLDVLHDVTGRPLGHDLIREPPRPHPIAPPVLSNDVGGSPALPMTEEEDPIVTPIAEAVGDLGLADHTALIEQTAHALADMHLGVANAGKSQRPVRHRNRIAG